MYNVGCCLAAIRFMSGGPSATWHALAAGKWQKSHCRAAIGLQVITCLVRTKSTAEGRIARCGPHFSSHLSEFCQANRIRCGVQVPVCIKNLPRELYADDSGPEQANSPATCSPSMPRNAVKPWQVSVYKDGHVVIVVVV